MNMPAVVPYTPETTTRTEVNKLAGATVVQFGTNWCGHCQRAEPLVQGAFESHPDVRHLKVEDGSGRPLGRSFHIKLWPTLVFLRDGQEVARVVRPPPARRSSERSARSPRRPDERCYKIIGVSMSKRRPPVRRVSRGAVDPVDS